MTISANPPESSPPCDCLVNCQGVKYEVQPNFSNLGKNPLMHAVDKL